MEERFFDTVYRVESPEGIVLELHPAGPLARLFAWAVDAGIQSAAVVVLVIIAALLDSFGMGLFFIGVFLLNWFYPVIFELLGDGATPGKRLLGLQVIKRNGTPVDLAASLIRNVLRVVDQLPAVFTLGLISMLVSRGFRRVGDLVAGTIVVYGRGAALPDMWRTASSRSPKPTAPALPLDFSEQRAIVSFAGRASSLGKARAEELAGLVAGRLDSRPLATTGPVASLMDLAAWITGETR